MRTQPDSSEVRNNEPEPAPWNRSAWFATLFLAGMFGWSILNITAEGARIVDAMVELPAPRSIHHIREYFRRGDTIVSQNLLGKPLLWAMHARLQAELGKSTMNNMSVVKGRDGRLYRGSPFSTQTENAVRLALDIAEFAKLAEEKGARVLYLGTPDTVVKGAKHLPAGLPYVDYNVATDALLFTLRERGVPFLDSRYEYAAHSFPADAISPKTAFLLTGEAAFALFTYLLDHLEERFSLNLDPDRFYRDPANYATMTRPDFFIGQLGKETGPAFGGLDDFTTLIPTFETEYSIDEVDMFGKNSKAVGSVEKTLLNPNALVYFENLYTLYPESYYIHTNAAWSRVVNPRNPDGPKLLVVQDFYTAQLISLLAPMCSEIHTLAYHEVYQTNAAEYIRDEDFDLVLISFFPQNILRPQSQTLVLGEDPLSSE